VEEQENFWGCEKILPEFPQTSLRSFRATFRANISSHTPFGVTSKKSLHVILHTWAPIQQRSMLILRVFSGSLPGPLMVRAYGKLSIIASTVDFVSYMETLFVVAEII